MKKFLSITSFCLSFSLLAQLGYADSMRCERRLISRGDHQAEVLASCGEPLLVIQKTIYRMHSQALEYRVFPLAHTHYSITANDESRHHKRSFAEVPVESWTYNFGPRYLMKEVTFTDGRVTRIKALGYGYVKRN